MSDRRFVLDTNLIVSALLLKQSTARQAFDKALAEGKLLQSMATIEELNNVLKREKFNKYVLEEERLQFLAALVREAILIEVKVTITDCRDPKDNKFLELAVSGEASAIISGDEDLLALHPFRDIPIFTPRDFLEHQWKEES
jgi:putative PIN family toxin of toxin-antitoxin system